MTPGTTVPTADYEVVDEDYEAWRRCGREIMKLFEEKIYEPKYMYLEQEYGERILNLLLESGAVVGEDFWFESYV